MTKNQIEYQKLQELKRSNLAQEALTVKRDQSNREIGLGQLSESQRHNLAYEAETSRHNLAVEDAARTELGIKSRQADTQQYDAETRRMSHFETARSNRAKETEMNRHNIAVETEERRSNMARETETHRSNLANESIGWTNARTNQYLASEQHRANVAREQEQHRTNVKREQQQDRALDQKDHELHNKDLQLGSELRVNNARVDLMRDQGRSARASARETAQDIELKKSQTDLNKQQTGLRDQENIREWIGLGADYLRGIGSVLPG